MGTGAFRQEYRPDWFSKPEETTTDTWDSTPHRRGGGMLQVTQRDTHQGGGSQNTWTSAGTEFSLRPRTWGLGYDVRKDGLKSCRSSPLHLGGASAAGKGEGGDIQEKNKGTGLGTFPRRKRKRANREALGSRLALREKLSEIRGISNWTRGA